MNFLSSIRFRLAVAFTAFMVLVLVLGLLSVRQLGVVNRFSSDIRDRWLQSTRVIGDLNNYTSDYRAAEANYLLSSDKAKAGLVAQDVKNLKIAIGLAQRNYTAITHDRTEMEIYLRFVAAWGAYEREADAAMALSGDHQRDAGVAVYLTRSKQAYDRASDTLDLLTKRTVQNAAAASERAATAYVAARALVTTALVAAVAIVGAGVLYISQAIFSPLLGLAERMRSLAANDTSIDVEGTARRDEIGEMARAIVVFRANALELARSRNALFAQARRLEESLDHERRLTALQRNFVSMASHEFRTPLTVIDGHAQRLISMKERLKPSEIEDRAGRVRRSVQRMTHVIDNLLDSSRLFDGEATLDFQRDQIGLRQLLHDVCQLHREISPGAEIVEDLDQAPDQIEGDAKLLFQAFSNLVSNAVKYSPEGGPITVRVAQEAGSALIAVSDRGIGIPKGDMANLFQRYYRGANVTGVVGTGVGLYLVKMVAVLHGGEMTVASQEGEGSCFTMRLPPRQAIPT